MNEVAKKSAESRVIDLQPASELVLKDKYLHKDSLGNFIENDIGDMWDRVASALASVEDESVLWKGDFLWALHNGAIPAGRITANVGTDKSSTSTINCVVSGTIDDSMESILHNLFEAGLSLKAGCGIGYEFSTLRPRGAWVSGAGSRTNGPVSFMEVYDASCRTIASSGGRRGAQMATFRVDHPDIMEIIEAKRTDGMLRAFNISILVTDEFMNAVLNDGELELIFPASNIDLKELGPAHRDLAYRKLTPHHENCKTDADGHVLCRIYDRIPAKKIWDAIMRSNYDFAEPGFILVDRVNRMNNLWFCEDIRATNPCGEQPLPPYGSCLLGSVNLVHFVDELDPAKPQFDFDKFCRVVRIFTRMLDNVVEVSGLPLGAQVEELKTKRRHGMGITGLGSLLNILGLRYGSEEAVSLTNDICHAMALESWQEAISLAKEKGCAPILNTQDARQKFCESNYWDVFSDEERSELHSDFMTYGARFTHATSIAPAGTISVSVGNNVSNGIEPTFSHSYTRNVIVPGKKTKHAMTVTSYEKLWADVHGITLDDMVVADDLTPHDHIAMQVAAQKWIDSSISKTVNVPTDIPFDDFQSLYVDAWNCGLKGMTTFRFNPEAFQGVLVRDDDLANTFYELETESGEIIRLPGNRIVEYDGEEHTVANLFDAFKEGRYGRY